MEFTKTEKWLLGGGRSIDYNTNSNRAIFTDSAQQNMFFSKGSFIFAISTLENDPKEIPTIFDFEPTEQRVIISVIKRTLFTSIVEDFQIEYKGQNFSNSSLKDLLERFYLTGDTLTKYQEEEDWEIVI